MGFPAAAATAAAGGGVSGGTMSTWSVESLNLVQRRQRAEMHLDMALLRQEALRVPQAQTLLQARHTYSPSSPRTWSRSPTGGLAPSAGPWGPSSLPTVAEVDARRGSWQQRGPGPAVDGSLGLTSRMVSFSNR